MTLQNERAGRRTRTARLGLTAPGLGLAVLLLGCGAAFDQDRAYVATELSSRTGRDVQLESPADSTAQHPELPGAVSLADGLTQDEAVSIALWNNAAFQEVLAQLGFSRAALIQAGLLSNPVLSVLFPLGPKQLEFTAKLPLEAFWLRPTRIAAARLGAEQLAQDLVQSGLDLIRDVRVAWVNASFARKRAALAEESVRVADRNAALAEGRLRAGDVSELEVTSTRVGALLAREEGSRAAHDLEPADGRLLSLLGLDVSDVRLTLSESQLPSRGDPNLRALIESALAARPDLRAAELALAGAREQARLSRMQFLAVAGGINGKGIKGSKQFDVGPAAELTIPVFDRNQGGIAHAEAEVTRTQRRYESLRQRIALEVKEARARYRGAQERAELWGAQAVPELEQALRRAERGYAAGDVSVLLLLQTTEQLLTVRARQLDALAEVERARAELERSVGCRLDAALLRESAP